jgi:hypothetical protein
MNNKGPNGLFSFTSIIIHLLLAIATVSIYYYCSSRNLFPQWIDYIQYSAKAFLVFLIILGSARSAVMPVATLIAGLLLLFTIQLGEINLSFISVADAWELIIMSFVGLIITVLVKWK